jgi:hypothetical protein
MCQIDISFRHSDVRCQREDLEMDCQTRLCKYQQWFYGEPRLSDPVSSYSHFQVGRRGRSLVHVLRPMEYLWIVCRGQVWAASEYFRRVAFNQRPIMTDMIPLLINIHMISSVHLSQYSDRRFLLRFLLNLNFNLGGGWNIAPFNLITHRQ